MTGACPECGDAVETPAGTDFEICEVVTTVEVPPNFPGRLPAADDKKADYPPEGDPHLSPRFEVGVRPCPGCDATLVTVEENTGEPAYGEWEDADFRDEEA